MKLHLPTALFMALMSALTASAGSYVADGVVLGDTSASTRFYDNGKGYYWTWKDSVPYNGAKELYDRTGSWKFMGDLAPRISGTGFSTSSFANLTQDAYTCWYSTSSNIIQYWESYYGVFYTGSRELPYGYTYDPAYAETLGGTQSLDIGLAFYDNMKNTGGHLLAATRWYLAGQDNADFTKTQGKGGYFADYFSASDCCTYLTFAHTLDYSNYRLHGAESLEVELLKALRLKQDPDGKFVTTQPGQLAYVGLKSEAGAGHAVTCYGLETDADSRLTALYVTNSDDREYSLLTLYVKEAADGRVFLYTDKACTQPWKYADTTWFVNGLEYINTPQVLTDMYGEYTDADNPLVWNGRGTEGWTESYTRPNTEKLPTAATGWEIAVRDAFYHSYYQENRPVVFDDTAASSTVQMAGKLTVPQVTLANVRKDYIFNGKGAVLNAPLHITGTGSAFFNGVTIHTGDLHYSHYSLGLGDGGALHAGDVTIGWNGALDLHNASAVLDSLTLTPTAALEVEGSGSLNVGQMTMESGSGLHLHISSANLTSPLLSFTGALTLGGEVGVSVDGTGLTDGKVYRLITLNNGYEGDLAADLHCYSGALTFSGNTLYLTYHSMGAYVWTRGNGTWSADAWNGARLGTDGTAVSFSSLGAGTVSVAGKVTPFSMDVTSGSYTFTAADEEAEIEVHHDFSLSGSAKVISSVPTSARSFSLKDKASLTFNVLGKQEMGELYTAAGTSLTLNGGSYLLDDASGIAGSLSLGAGARLVLDFDRDMVIQGAVSTAVGSSLMLASTENAVHYTLQKGLEQVHGSLMLGGGTGHASLRIDGDMTKDITLLTNGTLELHGDGEFRAVATGAGTIYAASCGVRHFAVENSRVTFSPTVSLEIAGEATIGSAAAALAYTLSDNVSISSALTVYFDHLHDAVTEANVLNIPHLTLKNGGTLNLISVSPAVIDPACFEFYHAPTTISSLSVGEGGGTIYRAPAKDSYFNNGGDILGYSSPIHIGRLSGSGDLTLQGNGHFTTTLYRIENPGAYTGAKLTLTNLATQAGSSSSTYNMVALEMGTGVLPTAVALRSSAGNDARCYMAFGLMGDVTIGGLDSIGNGSYYLYSGRMGGLLHSEDVDVPARGFGLSISNMLTDESPHTLTIDTAANHRFSGAVLRGVSIKKFGSGLQVFAGDMSDFNGSVLVADGRLRIQDNVAVSSLTQRSGSMLRADGDLSVQQMLNLHSSTLYAGSLTAKDAVLSGTNLVVTDSVQGNAAWVFGLALDNIDAPILTLESASGNGSLSLSSIKIEYDSGQLATASYKLLEYSSDFGGALTGISVFGDSTSTSIGQQGQSDIYFTTSQVDGKTVYTLMVDVENGGVLPPRKTPTSLRWQAVSGVWAVGVGHEEDAWVADVNNRNFLNGDSVEFKTAASVTIKGTVTPAEVQVNINRGSVVLSGSTGHISGTGSLNKGGAGELIISTSNSYSGGTVIAGGSVSVGHAKALGSGAVQLLGGVLSMGSSAVANAIVAESGTISGTGYKGALTVDGDVMVGDNFHAGSVTLLSGVLEGDVSTAAVNQLISAGGSVKGTLTLDGGKLLLESAPLNIAGHVLITSATALDLSAYQAEGQFTLLEAASLEGDVSLLTFNTPAEFLGYSLEAADNALLLNVKRLTTIHTWTAATGTWKNNVRIGTDIFETGNHVIFASPATVTISGAVEPGDVLVNNATGTVTLKAANTSSRMVGATALTKNGAGALVLNNGNTYTGGTVINAGTVTAGGVTAFGTGEITLNGGTLNLGKYAVTNPITVNGPANLKGTAYKGALTINGNLGSGTNFYLGKNATLNSGKVSGVLTGAAGVSVKGEGTLAGKNTYKGTTAVQAGGLLHLTGTVAGNIAVSGTLDSSTRTLTPASGKTLTVNNGGWVKGLVNVASGRTLVMKGTESAVDTVNLNAGTAVFDSTAAAQVLSGTGVFSMNGHAVNLKTKSTVKSAAATPMTLESGSITLTSSKGYAGPITLNGGTLKLGSIALTSPVTVDGTANLIGSAYKGALAVNGTLAGSTNVYLGKTATLNGGTVKGILKGKGGVIVRGESTLANKNTYTGTTNIQSGALLHLSGSVAGNILVNSDATLHNTNSISLTKGKTMKVMDDATVTGGVVVGSGATLAVYGDDSKLGATTINGGTAVLDSTAAAVVGTGTAALTVHGKKLTVKAKSTLKMAADEDITLRSGKLVLNATSTTYTGDLLAQGGTLDLASRAIKNDVYLGNAALMNGNALRGTLHVQNANSRYSGSLTLTSAQKLDFEAGSKLTVSGTLTLKGGTALTLSGDGWEEGEYTLISCGKLSGKAATAFKVSGADGFDSSIRSSGKNIILTLTTAADPELTAAPELTTVCDVLAEPERTAAAEEQEEETLTATVYEPDTYAAMQELAPTAEALVQSDWALVDTTRAFTSSIRNRSMGTLTQDGKGAIWANAVGSFARHGSVNSHSGSQVNIYGGSIGAERVFGEHHTLGVALGSTHTTVGGTAVGKLRQDATHLAAYGNSRMGSKFSADWAAAFGTAVIRGNMGANRGKWEQNSGELTARVTYTETLSDRTALRTFAGLDYDATGADRVNGYKTGSVQALRGELGVGLTHASENTVLYAEVGMVGDMVRHNPTVESAHFRLQGANPGRMGFRATLGGSIKLNETWSANAAYNLETAADATQQSVNVGVSRKF